MRIFFQTLPDIGIVRAGAKPPLPILPFAGAIMSDPAVDDTIPAESKQTEFLQGLIYFATLPMRLPCAAVAVVLDLASLPVRALFRQFVTPPDSASLRGAEFLLFRKS